MATIDPNLLNPNNPLATAGMAKTIAQFKDTRPELDLQYAQLQAQKEMQGANMSMQIFSAMQQQQQRNVENDLNERKFGLDTAKTGSEMKTQSLDYQSKMLDYIKQSSLTKASQAGPAQYMDALKQWDPEKYLNMQKTQTDIQTSMIGQQKTLSDINGQEQTQLLSKLKALGPLMDNIMMSSDPKSAYSASSGLIRSIDPSAPESYDENYVHSQILFSQNALDMMSKGGGLGMAAIDPSIKAGLISRMSNMAGVKPGEAIPGLPEKPDQKYVQKNILNPYEGVMRTPGTALEGRTQVRANSAQTLQDVGNDIMEQTQSLEGIPVGTKLDNRLLKQHPQLQELKDSLDKYQLHLSNVTGKDTKEMADIAPQWGDSIQNIKSKIQAGNTLADTTLQNAGVGDRSKPMSSGLKDPSTGESIGVSQISDYAKKYNIPYEQALKIIDARIKGK